MKLSQVFIFLVCLSLFGTVQAQEEVNPASKGNEEQINPVIPQGNNQGEDINVVPQAAPPPGMGQNQPSNSPEKSSKKKKKKKKKKDKGPALTATHAKTKRVVDFYIGETLKYKTKTSDEKVKGELQALMGNKVLIDSVEVKVSDLVMVGKKFGKTMGWRSVGMSQFTLGAGLTIAGAGLIFLGGNIYSVDNSNVVWSAVLGVVGTGTSFVGIYLMGKGGKSVFQSSNKKQKKGWNFAIRK